VASSARAGGSPRAAGSRQDPFGPAATSYLSTRTGTVLAAVYDVSTGQTWRLGQGPPQDAASVVKLDVLETLMADRNSNHTGLSARDRALAQQMIVDSDNDSATSLWYEVGGATTIRSFNTAAGLADTLPSSCVNCPDFPWPGWGLTTTTAADQLVLLRKLIEPSSLLTSAERSYALSLMENVTPSQRWGVSGGIPPEATVALKDGWLPLKGSGTDWQINSVGWICGQGRDYLMAVLITGNPTEQYGIDTIDQVSSIVWNQMK
jgi:beta-lactamase class A